MKILTMCAGGHVRSVGLKYRLTYHHGHEVLACGQDSNSPETIDMLCKWADYIIVLAEEYKKFIPEKHHMKGNGEKKFFCYDVGPDRFGYAFHPELQELLETAIQTHGLLVKK